MKNFINAKNLHKELKIRTRSDVWIKRKLKKIKAIEGVDFFVAKEKKLNYYISPKAKKKILALYNFKTQNEKTIENISLSPKKINITFEGEMNSIIDDGEIEELRKENKMLKKLIDDFSKFHSQFKKSINRINTLENIDRSKFKPNNQISQEAKINPILTLCDIHIGKIVNELDLFGYNAYDYNIAKNRIFTAIEKFITFYKKFEDDIETINILLLGDLIENDLNHHNELEFAIPLQIQKASELLLVGIKKIQEAFKDKEVRVFGVVGNHGRFNSISGVGKRMPTYDIVYSSYEFLIFKFLEVQGINIFYDCGNEQIAKIGDLNLLLTHGDNMKINTASPNSILNQIEKKTKLFQELKNSYFDLLVMGHLHTPFNYNNKVIIGGSPVGFDDFAKSLSIKPSKPSITSFAIRGKEVIFYKNIRV